MTADTGGIVNGKNDNHNSGYGDNARYYNTQGIMQHTVYRLSDGRHMIDDVFRNENGIRMQMTTIMSIIQGEEPGLGNASKLFF